MSAIPPCQHPTTAHHVDRARGQTSCMLCGEVLADQQFELDPAFARGERGGGGARGGPGGARPSRAAGMHGSHGIRRPSLDVARRALKALAGKLSITPAQVDVAAGIFKQAVSGNAVVGARQGVLCACLYIVCRRNQSQTPLTVLDFSDITGESPFTILAYVKTICKATSTTIPPVEPIFFVSRLIHFIEMPEEKREPIVVYAMKVMNSMRQDWIATGRRPLGVAAAAMVVSCHVHGIAVDLEALAGCVRLNQMTIVERVDEFSATPAASGATIDGLDADGQLVSSTTKAEPRAFVQGRATEQYYVEADDQRALLATFYQLVNEAKNRTPYSEDRQAKWRHFIQRKSDLSGIPLDRLPCDLSKLTHAEQLETLGIRVKREAEDPSGHVKAEDLTQRAPNTQSQTAADVALAASAAAALLETTAALKELNTPTEQPNNSTIGLSSTLPTRPPGSGRWLLEDVETLPLGDSSEDDEVEYINYDNEDRLKTERANGLAFKAEWLKLGAAFERVSSRIGGSGGDAPTDSPTTYDGHHSAARRGVRRERSPEQDDALASLRHALQTGGGGNIDTDRLGGLLGIDEHGDAPRGDDAAASTGAGFELDAADQLW